MNIVRHFFSGILSVLKLTGAPLLYRYPYRTSAEGLKADWGRIASDIDSAAGRLNKDTRHGK